MKTRTIWIFLFAVAVMFIGALAFGPTSVWAESNEEAGGEWGLAEDEAGAEDLEVKTNTTVDLVTPCRILDTRIVGGFFSPGQRREYYVYGPGAGAVGMIQQGGNPAGCPAPRSEPKGVIINIVAVPVGGQGNFGAFPANIAPPLAGVINYRAGVQNVSNGISVETYELGGPREIEFINRNGFSHLIVDVYGYYD